MAFLAGTVLRVGAMAARTGIMEGAEAEGAEAEAKKAIQPANFERGEDDMPGGSDESGEGENPFQPKKVVKGSRDALRDITNENGDNKRKRGNDDSDEEEPEKKKVKENDDDDNPFSIQSKEESPEEKEVEDEGDKESGKRKRKRGDDSEEEGHEKNGENDIYGTKEKNDKDVGDNRKIDGDDSEEEEHEKKRDKSDNTENEENDDDNSHVEEKSNIKENKSTKKKIEDHAQKYVRDQIESNVQSQNQNEMNNINDELQKVVEEILSLGGSEGVAPSNNGSPNSPGFGGGAYKSLFSKNKGNSGKTFGEIAEGQKKVISKKLGKIPRSSPHFESDKRHAYVTDKPVFQQKGKDNCMAVCTQMLLHEQGKEVAESKLARDLQTSEKGGGDTAQIPGLMSQHGLEYEYFSVAEYKNEIDLPEAMPRENSVIVGIHKDGRYSHAVIVDSIEYDHEQEDYMVAIRDPWLGEAYKVKSSDFQERWNGDVVAPKGSLRSPTGMDNDSSVETESTADIASTDSLHSSTVIGNDSFEGTLPPAIDVSA